MPLCSSTGKFASYDDPEADVEQEEINGSTLQAIVRCVRNCADCGEEMADYTYELEADVACPTCGTECTGKVDDTPHPDGTGVYDEPEEIVFELQSVDVEMDEHMQTTDHKGRPIKSYRHQKRMFVCNLTAQVKCGCCGEEFEVTASDETNAGSFEVLV